MSFETLPYNYQVEAAGTFSKLGKKPIFPDGFSPIKIWSNPAHNKSARLNLLSSQCIIGIAFFHDGQVIILNNLELTDFNENG